MCNVLPAAAGGLGHLVVMAAFRVVEFFGCLMVIEGEEAAAEAEGFDLDYTIVARVKEWSLRKPPCLSKWSGMGGEGWEGVDGTLLTVLTPLTVP